MTDKPNTVTVRDADSRDPNATVQATITDPGPLMTGLRYDDGRERYEYTSRIPKGAK